MVKNQVNTLISSAQGSDDATLSGGPVAATRPMRVLAAEDNPVFQSMLRTMLGKWGYDAVIARDGNEALRALPAEHLSRPIARYLAVYDSWLTLTTRITFNLSIWLFWFAMCYLLFFWKRDSKRLDS